MRFHLWDEEVSFETEDAGYASTAYACGYFVAFFDRESEEAFYNELTFYSQPRTGAPEESQ